MKRPMSRPGASRPQVRRLLLHRETLRQLVATDATEPQAPGRVSNRKCPYPTVKFQCATNGPRCG